MAELKKYGCSLSRSTLNLQALPVCQAQNEKFQKGRFKEEVLVLLGKISKRGDLFSPSADDLHGARQEIIELLDVLSVVSSHLVVRVSLELEFNLGRA